MIITPYLREIIDEEVALRVPKEVNEKVAKEVAKEVAKARHAEIVRLLRVRFGPVPADLVAAFEKVTTVSELDRLADWAETCPDMESFRKQFPA